MTRADIIQAAFRVWGRGLYKKTSLSQVAAELGVTKTALYRHFPGKECLLEAMYGQFFDDFAGALRADYERALRETVPDERRCIMVRSLSRYFCLHPYAFAFSLVHVYGNVRMMDQLDARGIELGPILNGAPDAGYARGQLISATVIFWVGAFHRSRQTASGPPGMELEEEIAFHSRLVARGLEGDPARVESVDCAALEEKVRAVLPGLSEDDHLLQAAAGAVALAGPWKASMNMVARRSGLSKSGLYAHFKNRQEMLARLFLTEFERLVAYAGECRVLADGGWEEELYLVIAAIAEYLRSRPEILEILDWLRIRDLDLGVWKPPRMYRIFGEDFRLPEMERYDFAGQSLDSFTQWVLFLVVNTFRWRYSDGAFISRDDGGGGAFGKWKRELCGIRRPNGSERCFVL